MLKIYTKISHNYTSSGEILNGEIIPKTYPKMSDKVKGLILWKNILWQLGKNRLHLRNSKLEI